MIEASVECQGTQIYHWMRGKDLAFSNRAGVVCSDTSNIQIMCYHILIMLDSTIQSQNKWM